MTNCVSCLQMIDDDARYCRTCGAQQPVRPPGSVPPPTMPYPQTAFGGPSLAYQARRTEGLAIASLVLGIVGIVLVIVIPLLPIVCAILAVVFGAMAKTRIAADSTLEGTGMATTGVVLGWVGIGLNILWVFFWIAFFSSFFSGVD